MAEVINPEEIELEKKKVELDSLENELTQKELEFAILESELRSFEILYLKVIGTRLAELDEINAQIKKQISYPKKREKALTKFDNYFKRNRKRVQYAAMQKQNLPIGSGCVESAIRRVVNLRMKSSGIFWKKETAEHMLFLRSQLLSGRWDIITDNIHKEIRSLSLCY